VIGRNEPLGEIVDFFIRVEFQMRGTPHMHAMFTIRDKDGSVSEQSVELNQEVMKKLVCESISAILVDSTGHDVSQ
jgi:hypothetical protein